MVNRDKTAKGNSEALVKACRFKIPTRKAKKQRGFSGNKVKKNKSVNGSVKTPPNNENKDITLDNSANNHHVTSDNFK